MLFRSLVLGMILTFTVLSSQYRAPFILLTGIGVFLTFSRSAILAWLIAVTGSLLMGKLRVKDFLLSLSISLLLVVLVLLPRWDEFLTTLERDGAMNKNVQERMAWLMDPTGVSDYSSWERKLIAKRAWDKTADHPLLGNGMGSSYETIQGTHNQYLSFMQDHGLIGAAILPLLIVAVTWGARGESKRVAVLFGGTFLLLGFFSHNIMNEPHALLLLGLLAAMALESRESQVKGKLAMRTAEMGTPKAVIGI